MTDEAGTGRLADNIAHFARKLRAAGLAVGPAAVIEAIRSVEVAGVGKQDLYWALHANFVTRRDQHAVFDAVFRLFWRDRDLAERTAPAPPDQLFVPRERPRAAQLRAAAAMASGKPREREREQVEFDTRLTVSDEEVFRRRDFEQMTAAEIAEAERRIAELRFVGGRVRTRRFTPAPHGRFDARRTLRHSLRTGGKLILPQSRTPREKPPPIVALLDVSGSMSPYSRMVLHFLHALGRERRVTSFVFGTRLTNITRQLRTRDPDEALAAAAAAVEDWAGGTRITSALHAFNRLWSRRVLAQGAIVLLVTDGLEREATDRLGAEMDRLHRSCRRLIWLNPLLRYPGFSAKAAGVRVMLPHVDSFRTVHSLESMAELCRALDERGEEFDPRLWLEAA
jgi:uncharacterized protein with von Willebrand factor type A (vWA) domain